MFMDLESVTENFLPLCLKKALSTTFNEELTSTACVHLYHLRIEDRT